MVHDLFELCLENFLVQQLEAHTHKEGNLLDLIFTNNAELIHHLSTAPVPRTSDHYLINFSAVYSGQCEQRNEDPQSNDEEECSRGGFSNLNFFSENVNWPSLNDKLANYNWSAEFHGLDTMSMMERFVAVCSSIAQQFVPTRRSSPTHCKSHIPRHRRILMRNRSHVRDQLSKTSSNA